MDSNYNNNPRKRNRNIIWFNPPFNKNVATTIGRYFLNLLDKHFPQDHKFHKIFNRNNIEVSYSCMPNIKSAINSHNRKILPSPVNNQSRTCNCINKTDCPLQEKCLSENIKQILVRKTFKRKFTMAYQKINLRQDIRTQKSPSTTKSTKMKRNYRMNSGKLKLQKKNQS